MSENKIGDLPLTIQAELYKSTTMFLREEMASGTIGDKNYSVCRNLYGNGLLVKIEGKQIVHISLRNIMEAIFKSVDEIPEA